MKKDLRKVQTIPYPVLTTEKRDELNPLLGEKIFNEDTKRFEEYKGPLYGWSASNETIIRDVVHVGSSTEFKINGVTVGSQPGISSAGIKANYSIMRGSLVEMGEIMLTNQADGRIYVTSAFDSCGISFSKEIKNNTIYIEATDTINEGFSAVVSLEIYLL